MSHTEGKLEANGGWIGRESDGETVAYIDAYDDEETNEANARRLVACWNALDGISTDAIESYPLSVNGMVHVGIIKQERDELLAALRVSTNGLRHCSRWNISDETEKAIITQVIANELILAKYKEA